MSSFDEIVTQTTSSERLIGRVKWFNNKAGYGFVTVTDGSRSGTDVFVHHISLGVENQQYKYLVQGEYVEFNLDMIKNSKHEFQAANVGGIKGGKLMCETRRDFKLARTNYKGPPSTQEESSEPVKMPRQQRVPVPVPAPAPAPTTSTTTQTTSTSDGPKNEWTIAGGRKQPSRAAPKPSGRGRGRPPRSSEQPK